MATKKELITDLISFGYSEDELKDKKNPELEALLVEAKEKGGPAQVEETEEAVDDSSSSEAPTLVENTPVEEVDGEVVAEFTQQLSIFNNFIYNARNEDVTLVVENLGFGDIYVSDKTNVRVGEAAQRLLFKEQRVFKGVSKLFFTTASQPVVSIIEVKVKE